MPPVRVAGIHWLAPSGRSPPSRRARLRRASAPAAAHVGQEAVRQSAHTLVYPPASPGRPGVAPPGPSESAETSL
eukprot:3784390-Lingulodinium_polyedra.AAC.1